MPEAEYTNDQGEHEMNVKLHEFFPFKGKKTPKVKVRSDFTNPSPLGEGCLYQDTKQSKHCDRF